jgi:death-on-curing protein
LGRHAGDTRHRTARIRDRSAANDLGGRELYPDVAAKASAIGFFLVCNHPFIDGNKHVGYAALETFLVMNGYELDCSVDETEQVILSVASGTTTREELTDWLKAHLKAT